MYKLIILCGKSASGKDALLKVLEKRGYKRAVSYTTRPMRPNEVNHKDYHFIKKDTFLKLLNNNGLIECREYDTVNGKWYYGLGKSEIDLFQSNYVTIKDLQGAKEIVSYFGAENCVVFYITASKYVRTERAKERGGFNNSEWERRIKADNYDFRDSEVAKYCNFKIENVGNINIVADKIMHYVRLWTRGNETRRRK